MKQKIINFIMGAFVILAFCIAGEMDYQDEVALHEYKQQREQSL